MDMRLTVVTNPNSRGKPPPTKSKFGAYRSCGTGNETFLISHMALSDRVMKNHINFWVGVLHPNSPRCLVWSF